MLRSLMGRGFVEEVLIISGLVGVQIIYAVYMVAIHRILTMGLNPLFVVIAGSFATAIFLTPFAVALERKKWPKRLGATLMVQFLLIAVGGVTAFQALMLMGIKKTSPAIASAMPNLAPGIIFIIAACVRFEKFSIRCMYSRAKVLGTLVCLSGAIAMSFLLSPSASSSNASPTYQASSSTLDEPLDAGIPKDWIVGCFYLLVAVIFLSCTTVLQAVAMVNFPAPFSLCVIISLMGSIITALVQFAVQGKLDVGTPSISFTTIILIILLAGTVTSACLAFQTWCVNKKGPVMVSIFSPIQTVCSAVLSALVLRQPITLGSLGGMLLMFGGLYIVLWAKKKEGCGTTVLDDPDESVTGLVQDIEKPLLS